MTLCERLFRLMDSNHDNLVNFKEIVQVFDGICKGDHTKKLKILYCLHLPGVVLPGELDSDAVDKGDTEVACSAEDFFDGANKAIEATTESLREGLKLTASPTPRYSRYRKQVRDLVNGKSIFSQTESPVPPVETSNNSYPH